MILRLLQKIASTLKSYTYVIRTATVIVVDARALTYVRAYGRGQALSLVGLPTVARPREQSQPSNAERVPNVTRIVSWSFASERP